MRRTPPLAATFFISHIPGKHAATINAVQQNKST